MNLLRWLSPFRVDYELEHSDAGIVPGDLRELDGKTYRAERVRVTFEKVSTTLEPGPKP